jgi:hypothetical protein
MEDQQPHLPVEILLQILWVLLQRHDRWSLSRVCLCSKAFQRLAEPILYQKYSIKLNTNVASTSYLSIRARNAPHVRDLKMLVRWENARSPQFQVPPMELFCNIRRLKVSLSSDFPADTDYYDRIWDVLSRIPSGCLRSFRYCPQVMPTGIMLTKLCDSLRAQFEIQDLSLISDWGNTYNITLEGDPLSTRFPKLRVFEGPTSIQNDHSKVTHFLWNYLDPEHAQSLVQTPKFSQLTFLRVNQLNNYSIQILEELVRCCPNLETLGIFSFYSDNRGLIMVRKDKSDRRFLLRSHCHCRAKNCGAGCINCRNSKPYLSWSSKRRSLRTKRWKKSFRCHPLGYAKSERQYQVPNFANLGNTRRSLIHLGVIRHSRSPILTHGRSMTRPFRIPGISATSSPTLLKAIFFRYLCTSCFDEYRLHMYISTSLVFLAQARPIVRPIQADESLIPYLHAER